VHGITTQEIVFYAIVWFVGFAASFSRAVRDRECVDCRNIFGLSATAGFVSFGVVAVLFVPSPDAPSSSWYWIGISALVGILGKEQDKIAKAVLGKTFAMSKVLFRDEEKQQ